MTERRYNKKNSREGFRGISSHSVSYEGVRHKMSNNKQDSNLVRESKSGFYCEPIKEFDRQSYIDRMSAGSLKISAGTKWSEKGETPSFKKTDDILMKAARRTYKSHSSESQ